jgi:hypothetical protein
MANRTLVGPAPGCVKLQITKHDNGTYTDELLPPGDMSGPQCPPLEPTTTEALATTATTTTAATTATTNSLPGMNLMTIGTETEIDTSVATTGAIGTIASIGEAAIFGAVGAAVVLGLICVVALIAWLITRRKRRMREQYGVSSPTPGIPLTPTAQNEYVEVRLRPKSAALSQQSTAPYDKVPIAPAVSDVGGSGDYARYAPGASDVASNHTMYGHVQSDSDPDFESGRDSARTYDVVPPPHSDGGTIASN